MDTITAPVTLTVVINSEIVLTLFRTSRTVCDRLLNDPCTLLQEEALQFNVPTRDLILGMDPRLVVPISIRLQVAVPPVVVGLIPVVSLPNVRKLTIRLLEAVQFPPQLFVITLEVCILRAMPLDRFVVSLFVLFALLFALLLLLDTPTAHRLFRQPALAARSTRAVSGLKNGLLLRLLLYRLAVRPNAYEEHRLLCASACRLLPPRALTKLQVNYLLVSIRLPPIGPLLLMSPQFTRLSRATLTFTTRMQLQTQWLFVFVSVAMPQGKPTTGAMLDMLSTVWKDLMVPLLSPALFTLDELLLFTGLVQLPAHMAMTDKLFTDPSTPLPRLPTFRFKEITSITE